MGFRRCSPRAANVSCPCCCCCVAVAIVVVVAAVAVAAVAAIAAAAAAAATVVVFIVWQPPVVIRNNIGRYCLLSLTAVVGNGKNNSS